jgi:hypothetical protein
MENLKIHLLTQDIAATIGQNESILLNQILYWLSKCGRKIAGQEEKWIYNSLAEWHKQFSYWSMYKLRKTIKSLEDLGLIKSIKVNAKKWNHTKWYTVDYLQYKNLLKKIENEKNTDLSTALDKIEDNDLLIKKNPSLHINLSSKNKVIRSTNRFVENQQIIITKNNYANNISSNKESGINFITSSDKKVAEIQIDSNEKEIINKMLYVWNKVFECSVSPIKAYNNQKNQRTLLYLYKNVFNSDLNKWREYTLKVNSSQFLMGEKETRNNFKAVFSWLIKEETIEKVQNGEYGVGDRELDMNNVSKNIEAKKEELVSKMDKKISEYMKLNIDEVKERKEFDEYVKTHKTEIKNDEYGILGVIKHISYYSLLKTTEYESLKESLYESYVMKKYLNISKVEARKGIRNKMKEMIVDKGENFIIFDELNKKGKEIEYLELSKNMRKIGLHSIL